VATVAPYAKGSSIFSFAPIASFPTPLKLRRAWQKYQGAEALAQAARYKKRFNINRGPLKSTVKNTQNYSAFPGFWPGPRASLRQAQDRLVCRAAH
jgi:hypothetical protein